MSIDPHTILLTEVFDALQIEELRRCDVYGLPCLSGNDQIVAALKTESRSMVIRLPRGRVNYLVAEGWGRHFAPSGLKYTEWVEIIHMEPRLWVELIREASRYAHTETC